MSFSVSDGAASGRGIVCVATGVYKNGQMRLAAALKEIGFEGRVFLWSDELPPGSPAHDDAPMGFKPFAVRAAIEAGCREVLWLDANYIPIRKLDPIFRRIERDGYYVYTVGSSFGASCADPALRRFGLGREKSFSILELNSSCVGFNADSEVSMAMLREWESFALDGVTFRGLDKAWPLDRTNDNRDRQLSSDDRVQNHRWDQTCASFLAWKHRLKLSGMEILNYQSQDGEGNNVYARAIPLTTALLHCRDTKRTDGHYLKRADRFGNRAGAGRIAFMILSLAVTGVKYIRHRRIVARTAEAGYYDPSDN